MGSKFRYYSVLLGVQVLGKHLLLHRYASFVAKNTTKLPLVVFFPAGKARAEDPAASRKERRLSAPHHVVTPL